MRLIQLRNDDPPIGTRRHSSDIGLATREWRYWHACPACGRKRWVKRGREATYCNRCSAKLVAQPKTYEPNRARLTGKGDGQLGPLNPSWRGGKSGRKGYWLVAVYPEDPLYCMRPRHSRYVMEHRLIMARHLGRPLERHEFVHHINGIKNDNRIENLELWDRIHPAGVRVHDKHCPTCTCHLEDN